MPSARGPEGGHKQPTKNAPLLEEIGELVTCPYCLAPWVSLALIGGYAWSPNATRLLCSVFFVSSVSDFLNRSYARLRG